MSKAKLTLGKAAAAGDLDAVKALIAGKSKIDARTGKGGRTPLLEAINYRHLPVALYLIKQKADPNLPDPEGKTPLIWSAIASRLVGNKIIPVVRALLKAGADVNLTDTDGMTPLMWAADRGVTFVKLLLKRGADVKALTTMEDNSGRNVLAFGHGRNAPELRLLLAAGADPNVVDDNGQHTWDFHTGEAAELLKKAAGVK
jgi:ankyrin repeat protein